ncbi:MAG: 16S rRNA (guanine(966)-N(2))-methyltransferase RsmD [Erysipelotrichaceae bacterium]|nr:16S rRNA (guanine(966)-N(2))-methyltransferase RsmD [Erysipelotrichaceae bacterium]
MIKIVSGKYGSRNLKTLPNDNTRPTSIKIRGAIFSRIGPYFDGGKVLDLFAGSGAFGIEAISRGISEGYFVDNSYGAINIIKENLKMVMEPTYVFKDNYKNALLKLNKIKFDIIFLDPPYKLKVIDEIILYISHQKMLNDDGVIICETLKEDVLPKKINNFFVEKEVIYGISKITYYKGEKNENCNLSRNI